MQFKAILNLESTFGNTVRSEEVTIQEDYTNDAEFINLVNIFKQDAAERTRKWELDGLDDSCYLTITSADPEAQKLINKIDDRLLQEDSLMVEVYECNSCESEIKTSSTNGPECCHGCGNSINFTYLRDEKEEQRGN